MNFPLKKFKALIENIELIRYKHTLKNILYYVPKAPYSKSNNIFYEDKKKEPVPVFFEQKKETDEFLNDTSLSIIIPSKDNADMLFRCIESLLSTINSSFFKKLEIIIVDNGSSIKNRSKIETYINKKNLKNSEELSYSGTYFEYIYEKKDFNFAYMCNVGAKKASCEFLLFLNDDVTAVYKGWLEEMLKYASLKEAGAVGAKLLYPDDIPIKRIQHCGIVNTRGGPMHVFAGESDLKEYAGGYNKKLYIL